MDSYTPNYQNGGAFGQIPREYEVQTVSELNQINPTFKVFILHRSSMHPRRPAATKIRQCSRLGIITPQITHRLDHLIYITRISTATKIRPCNFLIPGLGRLLGPMIFRPWHPSISLRLKICIRPTGLFRRLFLDLTNLNSSRAVPHISLTHLPREFSPPGRYRMILPSLTMQKTYQSRNFRSSLASWMITHSSCSLPQANF